MIGLAHCGIGSPSSRPVLLVRTPRALIGEPERDESEGRDVELRRLDLAREIRMSCVAPLLARDDDDDLGRYQGPKPTRPKRDHALASKKPAAGRPLLDREGDEFDRPTLVEVARRGPVLASLAIRNPALGRERLDADRP
jgi:hypothetical protein